MSLTADEFIDCVAEGGLGLRDVVEQHRRDYDEVLLHVLCGEIWPSPAR